MQPHAVPGYFLTASASGDSSKPYLNDLFGDADQWLVVRSWPYLYSR